MYIQDENQKIVGNLDVPGDWDTTYDTSQMWTSVVILPQIGGYVTYMGKSYVILSTVTYQEKMDPSDVSEVTCITTLCNILRITDDGDDAGEPSIEVRASQITLI
jgi:hypothetical protein